MATRNEWDELQYYNKENQDDNVKNWDRKLNDTDANDDGEDTATAHFTACVALHNWARARSPVPCTFITLTLAQVESCLHFTPSPWSSTWLSLFDSTYSTLYFSTFLLSVFFFPFFHLSDEQQPEVNKKIMENLCDSTNKGVRAPTTSSTSPHIACCDGRTRKGKTCVTIPHPYTALRALRERIAEREGVCTDIHPLTRTEQEEGTIYWLIFRKTRIAKYADVRKLRERHAQEILTIGRTELKLLKDLVMW